jgi:hypothetical protein
MRVIESRLVMCLLIAFSPISMAHNHLKLFDAQRNITNMSIISWETVDNVQARCEEESKKRGLGGFGINLEACSFWGKRLGADVCHIITEKKTNIDTLGHEVRHCFQGSFH